MSEPTCPFCRIIAGQAPAEVLYRDEQVIAFRDIHPQAPTHILVVPLEHVPYLDGVEDEQLLGHLLRVAATLADREGIGGGYRVVINRGREAGQSVFHLHLHLLGGRRMGWPPG